jgi:predicted transposase YbfD/YdcC
MVLKPAAFQAFFARWLQSLRTQAVAETGVEQPVLAVDGQTARRSPDRTQGLGALHSVSVWASAYGLSLGQVACAEKSNEITAIPELLRLVDIRGAIITIDAMGTQKEIAAQVVAGGGDYILAVKDNQPHLFEDLAAHFEGVVENSHTLPRRQRHHTKEHNRGRREERFYSATSVPPDLRHREAWPDLHSVGWVLSITERDGQESCDGRAYISSLRPDAKQLAQAVRQHWSIENGQHWVLDVVFNEDQCRARRGHETENLALLRRLALNLTQQEKTKMPSIRVKRRVAGWNDDLMLRILTAGTT